MFVYQTIGELVRFFHQPLHWQSLDAVQRFIGNKDAGAMHLLFESYYRQLRDIWPEDIAQPLEAGELSHPDPPYYCDPRE